MPGPYLARSHPSSLNIAGSGLQLQIRCNGFQDRKMVIFSVGVQNKNATIVLFRNKSDVLAHIRPALSKDPAAAELLRGWEERSLERNLFTPIHRYPDRLGL